MRKVKNNLMLLLAAALLVFILPLQQLHANADGTAGVDYVALGDSLAAGITPDNELGKGYTDFLAEKFDSMNLLHTYNKGFSHPGYTTTNVLADLQNDVIRDVVGSGYDTETVAIQDAITDAEIITISAGANDVLQHVDIDHETGELTVNREGMTTALRQVGVNLSAILTEIYKINPKVQVYVMGYYNPFPYLSADVQPMLRILLGQLNGAISNSLTGTTAILVETANTINENYQTFLPNPANIHLSTAGYEKVADLFWEKMQEEPEPIFNDVKEEWAIEYVGQAANLKLVNGYDDGSFKPYNSLTRVQAASILVRALGLKSDGQEPPFSDIAGIEAKTLEEIDAAHDAGLVKGFKDGKFKPYQEVTRAQVALMIKRAAEDLGADLETLPIDPAPFTDISGYDAETQDAIAFMYHFDIVSGLDGKYMPSNATSRQQAAKIFVNSYGIFQALE